MFGSELIMQPAMIRGLFGGLLCRAGIRTQLSWLYNSLVGPPSLKILIRRLSSRINVSHYYSL